MHSIELRCEDILRTEELLNLNVDNISVGNEGCIHKLPDIKKLKKIMKNFDKEKKILKLVLPFIPQSYIEDIKGYIKDIISWNLPI